MTVPLAAPSAAPAAFVTSVVEDAPLTVVGAGTTVVAGEALLARRDALLSAAAVCSDQAGRVAWVRSGTDASLSLDLQRDERELRELAEAFTRLARGLQIVAELSGAAERSLSAGFERLASQFSAAAGWLAARLGLVVLPGVLVAAGAAVALWRLLPTELRAASEAQAVDALAHAAGTLSEPALVELMRWATSLTDDAALGAAGVPPQLVALLGEAGLDASNVSGAATAVLGLAAVAGIHGTAPVRVETVATDLRRSGGLGGGGGAAAASTVSAPTSVSERIARIPEASAPVRVERYDSADGPRFEVYLAGTDSHAPMGGEQPWDMASNVALIAGHEASSLQAARAALDAAGATAESRVVFTGYSQGGAIATRLAESGEWSTAGLVTVGSPSGDLPVRGGYPAILVEHRDDLVPSLSGVRRETQAVIVQTEGLRAGEAPHDSALPAHDLDRYRATAERVDAAAVRELRDPVDALPGSDGHAAEGRLLRFTATRIPSA